MKQLVLISTLLFGLTGQVFALPIISLNPHTSSVIPGQNFFIDVNVSGLQSGGTNTLLGAFSMDVLFDPSLLQFLPISSSFGSALGDIDLGEAIFGGSLTSPGVFNFFGNYSPRTKSQKKLDRFLGVKNRNCRVMA